MKTVTETRPLATDAAVLRALGIKDEDLISLTLEITGRFEPPKLTLVKFLRETDPVDHIGGLDLDAMCQEALARVRRHINMVALIHKTEISMPRIEQEIRRAERELLISINYTDQLLQPKEIKS